MFKLLIALTEFSQNPISEQEARRKPSIGQAGERIPGLGGGGAAVLLRLT